MNHGSNHLYPGESGELVNGLTNHEHQRQTQLQGAFCCAALIELEDNSLFGLKKIKRWSVMRRQSQVHLCFSCSMRSHPFSLLAACLQSGQCVYLSVWQTFSTIHRVKWDHDCSSIPCLASPLSASWQFQVSLLCSLPGPPLLFPLTFLFNSQRGPTENTLRSRPLSPKAIPNPPHRSPWEFPHQRSRLLSAHTLWPWTASASHLQNRNNSVTQITWFLKTDVVVMYAVLWLKQVARILGEYRHCYLF